MLTNSDFNALCNANGFGAVARGAFPLVPRAMLKALVDAAVAAERERICAAIKAEDDHCVTDGDYMLDSDDCISVIRGTWTRPDYNPGPNGKDQRLP